MTRSYDELTKPVPQLTTVSQEATRIAEAPASASLGIKSREPIPIPTSGPELAARAARIKRPVDLGK
jgi:hypothetical protein